MGGNASKLKSAQRAEIMRVLVDGDQQSGAVLNLANPNLILDTENKLTPIHMAVVANNLIAVRQLVAANANVNARTSSGIMPLHLAAQAECLDIVSELLKRSDLDVNAVVGPERRTALMLATLPSKNSEAMRAEIVDRIAADPRCKLDQMDKNNWTALSYAAGLGSIPIVQNLLRSGRIKKYDIRELLSNCKLAMDAKHESVSEYILENLLPSQKLVLRAFIEEKQGAAGNGEGILALLLEAAKLLQLDDAGTGSSDSGSHFDSAGNAIKVGSIVKVHTDEPLVRSLQNGHGGWKEEMKLILGLPGQVTKFDSDGDVEVNLLYLQGDNATLTFNPKALVLFSKDDYSPTDATGKTISMGDTVFLLTDGETVHELQNGHGGFEEKFKFMLGKPGEVLFFDKDGDAFFRVSKNAYYFNPKCLRKADNITTSDGKLAKCGDNIRVISSRSLFEKLQTDQFGGWNDSLAQLLGKVVTLRAISCKSHFETATPKLVIQVQLGGLKCWLNPEATVSETAVDGSGSKATIDSKGQEVKVGSVIAVLQDEDRVKQLQIGHGGWSDSCSKLKSFPAMVTQIDKDGDLRVNFFFLVTDAIKDLFCINPKATFLLSKDVQESRDSNGTSIRPGDAVSILDSDSVVAELQKGHGSWREDKSKRVLGKPGILKFFDQDGDALVTISGQFSCFNPKALLKADTVICKDGSVARVGSRVTIVTTRSEFERLQTDKFGGWSSSLETLLQKSAIVQEISCNCYLKTDDPQCFLKVELAGKQHCINPKAAQVCDVDFRPTPTPPAPQPSATSELRIIPREHITLERKIGKGAFGTVFQSMWIATRCAVKQIPANDIIAGEEKERILQEARIHSRLVHPHIVQFLGISLDQTNMYIVLKCIDGYDLDEIIFKQKMKLTPSESHAVALQISDVVRFLHDTNVIHQDMKPSNVLVEKASKNALVTDFGISRMTGRSSAAAEILTDVTKIYTTTMCGTLLYMAPEQFIKTPAGNFRKPNEKSDIYALGSTLTELFSGKRLYLAQITDLVTLIAKKQSKELPLEVNTVPSQYRALLRRTMDGDPDRRPTALDLTNSLIRESSFS